MNKIATNFLYYTSPIFFTSMLATFTYPLAVRVARSKWLFGLRNFYAIHIAIAPFLALIHLNFYSFAEALVKLKMMEMEFREVKGVNLFKDYKCIVDGTMDITKVTPGNEPYGYHFYNI